MTEARGEITGKKPTQTADEAKRLPGPSIADTARDPITVTIREACRLSGYGPTTLWKLIQQERLRVRRVPGVTRTMVDFASLRELLTSEPSETAAAPRRPRPRGRPQKHAPQPRVHK
jgi:hypothetical protein